MSVPGGRVNQFDCWQLSYMVPSWFSVARLVRIQRERIMAIETSYRLAKYSSCSAKVSGCISEP